MKNLLIYTGSKKKFDKEHAILAKIQIDNSLDLGWKRQDILLVTDFPYSYNGVKSLIIKDGVYYDFDISASKLPVIVHLLNQGIIEAGELYWAHDFDAYQLNPIDEDELKLANHDLGLTHYYYKPEWQFGSLFFKDRAKDIFELLDDTICQKPRLSRNNEKTLTKLIRKKAIDKTRYRKMNATYNITKRCLATIYKQAAKPLKVLHFHPWDKDEMMNDTALNIFMYGKNRLKIPLMTERLIKIFNKHGIK